MIEIKQASSKVRIPEADYVLDKTDKLYDMINFLTPKFSGRWSFRLMDPTLKFTKELLQSKKVPDWIDITIYTSAKKIEDIVLEHPEYQPKKKTRKEAFNEVIATVQHILDEGAKRILFQALASNPSELAEIVARLDAECKSENITVKQVQSIVNYTKRVYASDVINAFLLRDARRWSLYSTLVKELGPEITYYACYKYVKRLLAEKEEFLLNKDVKLYIVKKIDAPLICYTYVLFANSTNYNQLYGLLLGIEHRGAEAMERIQNVNLQ